MGNPLSTLQEKDPSNVNGWLISALAGASAFLIQLQPSLDGLNGWKSATMVVFFAALPKLQGWLTSKDAFKPSTVDFIAESAMAHGEAVATERMETKRAAAAKQGAATRAAKRVQTATTETSSNPKPKIAKRSKAKSKTATKPARTTAK